MNKINKIKLKNIFLIGLLILVLVVIVPSVTHAALVECGNQDNGSAASGCKFSDLFNTAANLVNYLLSGAAVVAVGGVVYGGYLMVTSAGNTTKQGAGKKAVTNSMIGLAVILIAFLLVKTVFVVLGYRGGSTPLDNPGGFINGGPDLIPGAPQVVPPPAPNPTPSK